MVGLLENSNTTHKVDGLVHVSFGVASLTRRWQHQIKVPNDIWSNRLVLPTDILMMFC